MPKVKIIVLLSILVFLTTPPITVFAQTYNPGVSTGQYVRYGNFVGTGPGVESFNDYDWLKLEIVTVSGKEVTLLSTGQFKNGTAIPGNNTTTVWNVETGAEDGTPRTQGSIIATGLGAGDPIPPPNTYTINRTEDRVVLGVTKSVNILDVTISTPDYNSTLTYVYDRLSGMLLESISETIYQAQPDPVTSQYSYSIVETNIFNSGSISPLPWGYLVLAIGVGAVLVVVAVILSLRKRSR